MQVCAWYAATHTCNSLRCFVDNKWDRKMTTTTTKTIQMNMNVYGARTIDAKRKIEKHIKHVRFVSVSCFSICLFYPMWLGGTCDSAHDVVR